MSKWKDNDYKVYMHRNRVNGKVYVGCTKKALSSRFDNGFGYEGNRRFFRDIVKYGFDNFDHILLRDGMSRTDALALEEATIAKYDSMNPERGYNMRSGGKSNFPCQETCKAISKAKMGHVVTEETKAKLRKAGNVPVVQSTFDGSVVQVFPSITEAAQSVGAAKPNVWAVCNGRKASCKGFLWRYAEERDRVKHGAGLTEGGAE